MKQLPFNVMANQAAGVMAAAAFAKHNDEGFAPLERKEEGSGTDQVPDTKQALADLMNAVEVYQTKNDERLDALAKNLTDPLADDQLKKMDKFLDGYEELNKQVTLAAKQADAVAEHEKKFDEIETMINRLNTDGSTNSEEQKAMNAVNWARAAVDAIANGNGALTEDQHKAINLINDEYKALNVGTNVQGGYLAPMEMIKEIIKDVTEISPVRSLARVRQTGNKGIELPKRTGQFAAQWVAEQGTKSETDGLRWGVQDINTHEFYALIDMTQALMEDAMFNMVGEINTEAAEQFALAEGAAFVNGNGITQPEGYMVNAGVASTNSGSATTIADASGQANGLISLKYSLKSFYAANSTWLMNRTTMGSVRKLKTGDNQYLWMPGIAQGRPNTIDGDPYVEVSDMPSEGAGTYPIAYGDFRRAYTWVDRVQMEFLRDPYTQATGGKIRFIMRKRVGGAVTLGEAIKKLRCAA